MQILIFFFFKKIIKILVQNNFNVIITDDQIEENHKGKYWMIACA